MILTNCTDTARGISLQKGLRIIGPREMYQVPPEERDEVKALFKSKSFQRFVDNGIFRLSKIKDDEESVEVRTPTPPADLTAAVPVEGLKNPAGTGTGTLARAPEVVGHQTGGPLPEDAGVATEEKPKRARRVK